MTQRICSIVGCGRPHNAKGLCVLHGRQARNGLPFTNPITHMPACAVCGEPVPPNPHGGMTKKYCSKLCRSRADRARNGKRRERRRTRDGAAYQRMKYATDPTWRNRKLAKASARYALVRGAARADERFTLDDIFTRDGGKCHLCGKPVRRPDASMDHIIPVSFGGEHSLANVALAHRSCNSSKGTRAVGEQLRLVG